jgi:hypothetical protein
MADLEVIRAAARWAKLLKLINDPEQYQIRVWLAQLREESSR